MDLSYSEEHVMLRDSARRFLAAEYDPARHRAQPEDMWARFADMGWLAMTLPDSCGGLGGGAVELMVLMQEFGAALVNAPYVSTVVLGAACIAAAGDEAQQAALLPAVADGSLHIAVACGEGGGSLCASPETEASPQGSGWRIGGRKTMVLGGPDAGVFIVPARVTGARASPGGQALFRVPADAPGVTREDYQLVDGTAASDVTFEDVALCADARLNSRGDSAVIMDAVIDRAIIALAADTVGAIGFLLDATVQYAKTRVQFGQPIGNFQALQHRMADMAILREEAAAITLFATLNADAEAPVRRRAVSAAKVKVGRAARFVAEQSVQLHGAMGVTDELQIGAYLKRILTFEKLFGDIDFHRRRYAALLQTPGLVAQGLLA